MNKSNAIIDMFDIVKCKMIIASCPPDEIAILAPHWSINRPRYPDDSDPEQGDWDMEEFEELIGHTIIVTDYDDLAVDPHGIYNS